MELSITPMLIIEQFEQLLKENNSLIKNKDYTVINNMLYLNLPAIFSKIKANEDLSQYTLKLRKHPSYAGRGAVRMNGGTLYLPMLKL